MTILLLQLFTVSLSAQRHRAAGKQTTLRRVQYEELRDYINDYDKRHQGERLIANDVPLVKEIARADNIRGAYYLTVGEENGAAFITSAKLAKSLRPFLKSDTTYLRITCTLVEFAGEFDVSRLPFAIKIEGLDEYGEVSWTVLGTPPARLKYRT